jgi:hypothetical protein
VNTTEKCNHVGFWIAGTPVRCDQPMGHDGDDHTVDDGTWRWSK